jgi:hypothetical protein
VNKPRTKVNKTKTELKQNETQTGEIPQQNRQSEKSEHKRVGGVCCLLLLIMSYSYSKVTDMPGPLTNHANSAKRLRCLNFVESPCRAFRLCALCGLRVHSCSTLPNATERNRTISGRGLVHAIRGRSGIEQNGTISKSFRFGPRCTNDLRQRPHKSFRFLWRKSEQKRPKVTDFARGWI